MRKQVLMMIALLAATTFACGMPEPPSCKQRDVAAWTRATVLDSAPIMECGSVVGYRLDLDGSAGSRTWALANSEPHPANGVAKISAEIDVAPGVERAAVLSRGPAAYDLQYGGSNLTVSASVNTTAGPLLREFRITVPAGIRYVGEIRNLRW